jgi:hypothetical protein
MIRYGLYILVLFLLLVIQAGLVAELGLGMVGNLLLLFTIVAVVLTDVEESLAIALLSGFMLDLVSGPRDGTFMICFVACFGFTYFFIYKFVPREPDRIILFSCIVLNTILFAICFVVVNKLFVLIHLDTAFDWHHVLGKKLLLDLGMNTILAYPVYLVYLLVQKVIRRLETVSI